jgi:hypothetical protein
MEGDTSIGLFDPWKEDLRPHWHQNEAGECGRKVDVSAFVKTICHGE